MFVKISQLYTATKNLYPNGLTFTAVNLFFVRIFSHTHHCYRLSLAISQYNKVVIAYCDYMDLSRARSKIRIITGTAFLL